MWRTSFKEILKGLRLAGLLFAVAAAAGCRQDMHDQPKYEPLEPTTFFEDGRSSRPPVEGTVARGFLNEDVEFFTGRAAGGQQSRAAGQGQDQGGQNQPASGAGAATGAAATPNAGSAGGGAGIGAADTNRSSEVQAQYQGFVSAFPIPVTQQVMDRGEERYNIYCSVCHSRTGDGNGMVVRRGYRKPTSLHDDRLRQAPVGYFFDVITNGFGAMPDYSAQITPRDRWAIIAYIRALQRSQQGTISDVPQDRRGNMTPGGQRQEGNQQ